VFHCLGSGPRGWGGRGGRYLCYEMVALVLGLVLDLGVATGPGAVTHRSSEIHRAALAAPDLVIWPRL